MADTVRTDVEDIKPESGLTNSQKDALVEMANRFADDVFGGTVRSIGEVEGDDGDFKRLLAAHLWELAEGGEAQSESQSGGSVSYSVNPGNVEQSLSQTRYGRMARAYLRQEGQVGVEWA